MTREEIVDISNDLLKNHLDINKGIKLISEYCDEIDKSKTSKIISMIPSLPQDMLIPIIKHCLDHFGRKFAVEYLFIPSNQTVIINGIEQKKIIQYF